MLLGTGTKVPAKSRRHISHRDFQNIYMVWPSRFFFLPALWWPLKPATRKRNLLRGAITIIFGWRLCLCWPSDWLTEFRSERDPKTTCLCLSRVRLHQLTSWFIYIPPRGGVPWTQKLRTPLPPHPPRSPPLPGWNPGLSKHPFFVIKCKGWD